MKNIVFASLVMSAASVMAGEQLLNLPAAPKGGRFKAPTELVWPAKAGEADVCLWADDKFGACAITIDDNCQPDHEWWLKLSDELGIKLTWFVVSNGVLPRGAKNQSFNGNWDDWQKLANAGHSIQSHTTNHKSDPPEKNRKPDTKLLTDDELTHMYKDSIDVINANVTNNVCTCLAYPSGDAHVAIAAKYAIGARGVYGVPSCANSINYMCTNKGGPDKGCVEMVAFGETKEPPKWIAGMKGLRRGLNIILYHFVHAGRTPEEREKNAAKAEEQVRYVASLKDRLWVCRFDDVMKYGQERDTAKLAVTANSADKIAFTLSDDMKDEVFNFPLTIKVRLPDGWKSVKATQNGKPVAAKFVEHEGAPYALVASIPDRGETVLTK